MELAPGVCAIGHLSQPGKGAVDCCKLLHEIVHKMAFVLTHFVVAGLCPLDGDVLNSEIGLLLLL